MNQPVMVVLDPEVKAPQPAFEKARTLARAMGAPLDVVVNAYSAAMVRAVGFDKSRFKAATNQIEHAWDQRIRQLAWNTECEAHVLWEKHEIDALRDIILSRKPRMVVVHTSVDSGLRRHLFTPRDWQLIRKAPCEVLCVHSQPWPERPALFAALDPRPGESGSDPLSIKVANQASELAGQLGGSLRGGHVLEAMDDSLVLLMGEALSEFSGSLEEVRASRKAAFEHFASEQGLDPAQQVTLEGPVAPTLSNYCKEQKIDLLIVGTVHRNLPERLMLGATAEAVITRASTDVLVVKPDDFQSPWMS